VCAAEQNKLLNVINDPRARVGSMREKNDHKNSAPDNEQRLDDPDRSLSISGEPAPIDIAAFGKRLGEIISKALRAPVIAIALQCRTSHLQDPPQPVGIPLFGG